MYTNYINLVFQHKSHDPLIFHLKGSYLSVLLEHWWCLAGKSTMHIKIHLFSFFIQYALPVVVVAEEHQENQATAPVDFCFNASLEGT